jgi:hypothetical protein
MATQQLANRRIDLAIPTSYISDRKWDHPSGKQTNKQTNKQRNLYSIPDLFGRKFVDDAENQPVIF